MRLSSMTAPNLDNKIHPKSPVSLDIVIVGAGLSGLGAAISCSLSGHKVTVYESATELQEVSRSDSRVRL